jgi:acetoacetyl-CoA synthetase
MIELRTRIKTSTLSADAVAALWERLLDFSPVGVHDDFFDLGGDSLLALHLFHEIETVTGRTLPITAIYDTSTPARLADLLSGDAAPAFSPLVPLKNGAGDPLYIVHGTGGTVIELIKLGQLMDTARPVFAIQARGIDGDSEPHDRVEHMVDDYLRHIRARQPRGPYFLAGYSFGGMIAMDMARKLQEEGESVALLTLIDSFAHPQTFPKAARQLAQIGVIVNAFTTKPFGEACAIVMARIKAHGGAPLPAAMMLADFPEDGITAALRQVHVAAFEALTHYWPTRYHGEVLFIRPATSIFSIAPKRIWGGLIRRLRVVHVPGDHGSMVRAHVAPLAKALSRALRDAAGDGEWM